MIGAIIGDVAGSVYEFHPWQGDWRDIPLFTSRSKFTDDTVLSFAVAAALMAADGNADVFQDALVDEIHAYGAKYPKSGYGGRFAQWLMYRKREPYNSFGNGSAMRVSPVGWAFASLAETERWAAMSAAVTHNHPEGIKGAQVTAGCIFLARNGADKDQIRAYAASCGYSMDRTLEQIRDNYTFDETCQGSVPEAIAAFLESGSFEETIRKAIWLRGDADTQAAIAGGIAGAYFGIPGKLREQGLSYLDDFLWEKLMRWREWLAPEPACLHRQTWGLG